MSRHLSWLAGGAGLLALAMALVLVGCSGTGTGRPVAAAPTASSSPTVPSTPSAPPSAAPTVTQGAQPCASEMGNGAGIVRAGDLLLEPAFTDPQTILLQLPDGTPLKPLKVPQQTTTGQYPGWPTSTLDAGPVFAVVCNGSTSTAHTIQGARVKLTAFTAYTAQLSEWDVCAGSYARPAGVTNNCGDRGGPPMDEGLQAAFAANAQPGTIVTATQQPSSSGTFGPLPAVLPPGVFMYLYIGVTAPSAPGTYTFAVSLTADGAALPFTDGTSMLLAPVAHVWNGQACTSSSMLAQIPPATNPPTPYICPVS
jgi:hypothetical protein